MKAYVFVDASGFVSRAGSGSELPEDALELPADIAPTDALSMMLVDGTFMPCPRINPPDVTAFETNGRAAQFRDLPAGTSAEIIDVDLGYIMATEAETDGVIIIALPDPGRYQIDVNPPRPHLPMHIEIEVPQ